MSGTRPDSPPAPATSQAALVIAAHGDCGGEGGNVLASELARRVRAARCYDEVAVGYMRSNPSIEEAVAGIAAPRIRLYPLFMSDGYYVRDALPRRLGLCDGTDPFGHTIAIDAPLGVDPRLPGMLLSAAVQSVQLAGFQSSETSLLLVAHGSGNSPHSADAARAIAAPIGASGFFASTDVAFLEEEPRFADALVGNVRPLAVLGLFAGGGLHAEDDVRAAVWDLNDPTVILVEQLGGYAPIIEMIAGDLCRAGPQQA